MAAWILGLIRWSLSNFMFRGTVTGTSGNQVLVQRFAGDTIVSCARLASYSAPAADDEVLVVYLAGGYLVLGEIVR